MKKIFFVLLFCFASQAHATGLDCEDLLSKRDTALMEYAVMVYDKHLIETDHTLTDEHKKLKGDKLKEEMDQGMVNLRLISADFYISCLIFPYRVGDIQREQIKSLFTRAKEKIKGKTF